MIMLYIGRACIGMACFFAASTIAAPVAESSFDFSAVPFNQVVTLYFKEVSKRPYMVCSDVLADARTVSLRASGKALDGAVFDLMLEAHGYEAKEEKGLTVVCKKSVAAVDDNTSTFFYRPMHRDSAYLVDFLAPLVKGVFANKRAVGSSLAVGGASSVAIGAAGQGAPAAAAAPMSSSAFKPSAGDDYIMYSGTEKDILKLQKLLAQVDAPTGEVVIKGYMYEVGKNSNDASALDLVLSLLNGKMQATIGGSALGNALRIKTASIDIVASALNADGRFKVVTSPFTRVRSGGTARFVVGSDVPVLGAIVTNQGGQTQQSVEYRSSGTIFEVSPKVRDKSTDIDLFQQVSSFVTTDTGVNTSPTLNKRELRTSLTVDDGEILVIGGLNDSKEEEAKSGLPLFPFPLSKSRGARNTELLLVLELKRI